MEEFLFRNFACTHCTSKLIEELALDLWHSFLASPCFAQHLNRPKFIGGKCFSEAPSRLEINLFLLRSLAETNKSF